MYQIERRTIAKVCPNCKQQFAADDSLTHCPTDQSLLSPVIEDPLIGSVIAGKYEILLLIGCGGWSMVYKARHVSLNRLAAVKVLHSHLVSNPEKVQRFEYEAKAASGLVHNNVANVYDFGMLPNGQPYLVMDYLEGKSLAEVLRDEGAISLNRAINIAMQAGSALSFAHSRGVIHRDFKPANVMLMNSIYCKEAESRVTDLSLVAAMVSNQATTGGVDGSGTTVNPMRGAGDFVEQTTSTESIFAPPETLMDQPTSADPIKAASVMDQPTSADPIKAASTDQPTAPQSMPAMSADTTSPESIRIATTKTDSTRNTEVDLLVVSERPSQPRRAVVPAKDKLKSFQPMVAKVSPLDDMQDDVQILDFGLAKLITEDAEATQLTKTGDTLGTPPYMSPEQCLGKKLDARSDIYSFGCVLFEMLTGRAAIEGASAYECMHKHLNERPRLISEIRPDLQFPPRLVNIVARLLNKDRRDRYQDMEELLADLELYQTAGKSVARPRQPMPLRWKWRWRPRPTEVVALVIIVVFVGMFAGDYLMRNVFLTGQSAQPGLSGYAFSESPEGFLQQIEMARGRGDLVAAEKIALRARDVMARQFGKQSGQYVISLFLLAMVQRDRGNIDDMAGNFESIFAMREQFPPTQETVMALKEMGDYYVGQSEFEKADVLYADASVLSERVFGSSHANHGVILYALGRAKVSQGKDKEALPYLNQAFSIQEKWLGPMNPQVAGLAFDLAKLNERLGYLPAAEIMYKRALDLQAGLFGPKNPHSAKTLRAYAELLDKSGRKGEARKLRAQADAMKSSANNL